MLPTVRTAVGFFFWFFRDFRGFEEPVIADASAKKICLSAQGRLVPFVDNSTHNAVSAPLSFLNTVRSGSHGTVQQQKIESSEVTV